MHMATLQASSFVCCPSSSNRGKTMATINIPKIRSNSLSLPKIPVSRDFVQDLVLKTGHNTLNNTTKNFKILETNVSDDPMVMAKLYAIMEAVADRIEMHANICEQRNNWNSLLLTSINAITLAAATMTGIAATSAAGSPILGLKLSSSLMYLGVTVMLKVMNKIQPSQLAEEQRNATRLFKKLRCEIQTCIAIGHPTMSDVEEAMENVLALDRAFPLPLLGAMLEKFPSAVEPAVWWAPLKPRRENGLGNGWNGKLEGEMREIVGVLGENDKADYLKLGQKALKINKALAISGPFLTGVAAIASAFVGPSGHGSWAAVMGVVAGALASVVNTMEHGGQVGMVVELYRGNAGFFKLMEEMIESNLNEENVDRRENGELFEMKVALQLGRSLSELRNLAAKGQDTEEFGSKLF